MRIRQVGFTIVEVLIVIVVIGILSTIVVVAYNGATERARNASRLTSVTNAVEAVKVLLTKYKPSEVRATLNNPDGWYRACIGMGLKDINGDAVGDCGYYGTTAYASESSAFKTMLQSAAGLPDFTNYPPSKSQYGDTVAGPYLDSAWVDSKDMLAVEYSLEGEKQSCGIQPLIYKNGSLNTLTPGSHPTYTDSGGGVTACIVAVVTNYY